MEERSNVRRVIGNVGIIGITGTISPEEDCPVRSRCEYKTHACTNQRYAGCNFYKDVEKRGLRRTID